LDDAHRAFEPTYLLVAQTINSVIDKPLGRASSADAAQPSVKTALEKMSPGKLDVEPSMGSLKGNGSSRFRGVATPRGDGRPM
jgi:hypothetical protein